jgi:hypothetical protein
MGRFDLRRTEGKRTLGFDDGGDEAPSDSRRQGPFTRSKQQRPHQGRSRFSRGTDCHMGEATSKITVLGNGVARVRVKCSTHRWEVD